MHRPKHSEYVYTQLSSLFYLKDPAFRAYLIIIIIIIFTFLILEGFGMKYECPNMLSALMYSGSFWRKTGFSKYHLKVIQ